MDRVRIVIPTTTGYSVALQTLWKSLPVSVRHNVLLVYVNDTRMGMCLDEEYDVECLYCDYNAYEYSAIGAVSTYIDVVDGDYFLFLHDTCKVEDNFESMVCELIIKLDREKRNFIYGCAEGAFNIGIATRAGLQKLNGPYGDVYRQNIDKYTAWRMEVEKDHPWSVTNVFGENLVSHSDHKAVYIDVNIDVYGTGVNRHIVHLPDLGLIKYPACNNFQGDASFQHPNTP